MMYPDRVAILLTSPRVANETLDHLCRHLELLDYLDQLASPEATLHELNRQGPARPGHELVGALHLLPDVRYILTTVIRSAARVRPVYSHFQRSSRKQRASSNSRTSPHWLPWALWTVSA